LTTITIEVFAVLECYAALVGSWLLKFRNSLSVTYSHTHLKMGQIGCSETSVTNCQPTQRNIPEQRGPQIHCGRNLKPRTIII